MSKTLFSFLIGELKIIRLICKDSNCGGIAEMPVEKLGKRKSLVCPLCHVPFEDTADGPLARLGKAMRELDGSTGLAVEFVLPEKVTT